MELKLQQSIESDEGGYDYHQEMAHTAGSGRQTEAANANDSEAATVEEEEDRCDDAASETGTYTIGKDSPSPDEDQSRRDIDRVFGLSSALSVQSDTSVSTVISAQVESIDSGNRSTPQWIREWAAQVAQQQEAPPLPHIVNIPAVPASLAKPPSHPRPPPPELPTTQRPRRRLPSVPPGASNGSSSRSRSSPRPSDMSDPSDSSLETESFLRDTESVVSAMQVFIQSAFALISNWIIL